MIVKCDWLKILERRNSNSSVESDRSFGSHIFCVPITVFSSHNSSMKSMEMWNTIVFFLTVTRAGKRAVVTFGSETNLCLLVVNKDPYRAEPAKAVLYIIIGKLSVRMGRKRKRGQSKHDWGIATSRKQKKKRKIRGKIFNRGVKAEKQSAYLINCMMENISLERSTLPRERHQQDSTPPCCINIPAKQVSTKPRLCGVSSFFIRLKSFSGIFQRPTRFSSVRNVFLLLDWLRQIFGCGLQTLGKVGWTWSSSPLIVLVMFSYKYDVKQKHVLSLAAVVKMSLLAGGKEASASRESCLLAPGPVCSKRG